MSPNALVGTTQRGLPQASALAPRITPSETAPKSTGAPDSRGSHGYPMELVARAIRARSTGALMLRSHESAPTRRLLLRDGDVVIASSTHPDEALIFFLMARGEVSKQLAEARAPRLPHSGRHAAAALIAHGFLSQDDLWPILRAHAEWIIGRAFAEAVVEGLLERQPPARLRAEPNVFGGATGVEVFIELVRRALPAAVAVERLGGAEATFQEGGAMSLLAESALENDEVDAVRSAIGQTVGHVLAPRSDDTAALLYALCCLGILSTSPALEPQQPAANQTVDPLDTKAVRQRVANRLALVHDGDYFALLGVPRKATGYEIRRAFVQLRRSFEPSRVLTAATADLSTNVVLIVEVLEEAYDILKDTNRRNRYRRAIEATS